MALGGAVGSVARYGVSVLVATRVPPPFALVSTLTVNLVGSLLIGLLFSVHRPDDLAWARAWLLLATGLLGGFTTFSTFSLDVIRALQVGQVGAALVYTAGSLVGGLLACGLGVWAGGQLR